MGTTFRHVQRFVELIKDNPMVIAAELRNEVRPFVNGKVVTMPIWGTDKRDMF
jgi:hypothetical protein